MWKAHNSELQLLNPGIHGRKQKHEIFIRWTAPPYLWIALNTDGAAKRSPGMTGGGGILRDAAGIFIMAFTAHFGRCNAYKTELLALELSLQNGY
uniref:RNase H type-1 domain-containing protein n=1 Tax=Chenopodium quinoa TaxID=63459 RepID=A0A803LHD5_CHEQI